MSLKMQTKKTEMAIKTQDTSHIKVKRKLFERWPVTRFVNQIEYPHFRLLCPCHFCQCTNAASSCTYDKNPHVAFSSGKTSRPCFHSDTDRFFRRQTRAKINSLFSIMPSLPYYRSYMQVENWHGMLFWLKHPNFYAEISADINKVNSKNASEFSVSGVILFEVLRNLGCSSWFRAYQQWSEEWTSLHV